MVATPHRLGTRPPLPRGQADRDPGQLPCLFWGGTQWVFPSSFFSPPHPDDTKFAPCPTREQICETTRTLINETTGKNTEFTAAALEFPQAVVVAAECLRLTPSFLRPLVASLATRRHRASQTLRRHLGPLVRQRLSARPSSLDAEKPTTKANDVSPPEERASEPGSLLYCPARPRCNQQRLTTFPWFVRSMSSSGSSIRRRAKTHGHRRGESRPQGNQPASSRIPCSWAGSRPFC